MMKNQGADEIGELYDQDGKISENIIIAIPDGINIVNEDGLIVYQNKILKKILGADAIGKKCYEACKDNKRQCELCPLKKPIKVGETSTIETTGIGQGRTFLISHTGIMVKEKKHILEVFRDITDYRKIEEKYSTLSNAVEQSHASVIITDTAGAIQYVNPHFTEATGYSWAEVVGQNPRILKSGKQGKTVYLDMWQTIKSGKNWQGEFCNKKKSGELYWERVSVSPVKNSSGAITNFVAVKEDFTDYKKSQEALQVSLKRYQSFIDLTGQIGWRTNAAGEVVEDLPSWRKFTGQTYEEISGWGWTNALHPDDFKHVTVAWVLALKTKRHYEIQYRLRRHDGIYRYFMVRGTPVLHENGSVIEWVGTCIDITEREQAEKKMEHLASFARLSPNPIIETDINGNVLFFNSATLEILKSLGAGYDFGVFLASDLKEIFNRLKQLGKNEPIQREIKVNNRVFSGNIYLPKDLQVIRFYFTEITEKKNTEERLAEERKIIDTIIENSSALLVYLDADFNFIWVNSAYAKTYFLKPSELIGRNYFKIFLDEDNKNLFKRAKETGETITAKARAFDPAKPGLDATYWDWTLTPIKDSAGQIHGFVYSVIDVTENKNAEMQKNNFIAVISHELRNPLAPILTGAQLIQKQIQNDPASKSNKILKQATGIIEQESKNMSRLLDDLLDITRINRREIQLKKRVLNIAPCLDGLLAAAKNLARAKQQTLSVSLPASPLFIDADPVRLEQIISNLLNNAIKYTDAKGSIWLEIGRRGDQAEIRVRDTGLGIKKDRLDSIFNLFPKSSDSYISTRADVGIGLKLTKDLVSMHGGTITVHSQGLNKGSEFIVSLPALAPNYVPDNQPATPKPALTEKLRIMIIDDNKDIANMQGELFNFYGYDTRIAYDGRSALSAAETYKPQVAIIDIGLPVMDGYEVAKEFKKLAVRLNQKIKLIAATGYGQEEDKRRSREAGFNHHFVKPVDFDLILEVLKEEK